MRRVHASGAGLLLALPLLVLSIAAASTRSAGGREQGRRVEEGKQIFRFETFDDEQLWTTQLRMHEAIAKVDPLTALSVGLKVDSEVLPSEIIAAIRAGSPVLKDPAVTVELLRLNAVVGVMGRVNAAGQLTSIGLTCAFCHSTVDDSVVQGVGRRLDGWANTDLDVGKIVTLSPSPLLDQDTRDEFLKWGPGKYDPRHHAFDGSKIIFLHPGEESLPVVIPPIYGLRGVDFETYTADGPISYWNAYVGIGQMGGRGNFNDPRINLQIAQEPDLVTPKLPALLDYQLSLDTPRPPAGSFDRLAANRGQIVFRNEARCDSCHRPPNFTDVLTGSAKAGPFLHDPSEVGTERTYAMRSATKKYRTTPLRALWQHPPYFHDGSAPDLLAVVNHYDQLFRLGLTASQKADLVEFLKSL
jgi:hypothetical protein